MSAILKRRGLRRRLQAICCSCICAMIAPWDRCAVAGPSAHHSCHSCRIRLACQSSSRQWLMPFIACLWAERNPACSKQTHEMLFRYPRLQGNGIVPEACGQNVLRVPPAHPANTGPTSSALSLYVITPVPFTHNKSCRWWPCAMSWWAGCPGGPGNL